MWPSRDCTVLKTLTSARNSWLRFNAYNCLALAIMPTYFIAPWELIVFFFQNRLYFLCRYFAIFYNRNSIEGDLKLEIDPHPLSLNDIIALFNLYSGLGEYIKKLSVI